MVKSRGLAEKLDITVETLSNYENGKTKPDIFTILKLADFFECTTDDVMKYNNIKIDIFSSFALKIIKQFRKRNKLDDKYGKAMLLNDEFSDNLYNKNDKNVNEFR